MKFNIAYPPNGTNKVIEVNDMTKLNSLFNLRISSEITGETLDDSYLGYIFKITGGNDKQGFTMKQGVLTNTRVRLLLSKGHSCYRPRRKGERKRKSVRGCIVDGNMSVIAMTIVRKGEGEIPGLTDNTVPRRLGPKRASKIRKLFNLSKEDDVRQYVIKTPKPLKEGKTQKFAAPKVQRLVTPAVLQRRRHLVAVKRRRQEKSRLAAAEYSKILAQRQKEQKELKELKRKRSASLRESKRSTSSN